MNLAAIVFTPLRLFCNVLLLVGHHLGFGRRDLALFAWVGVGLFAFTESTDWAHRFLSVFYLVIIGAHLALLSRRDATLVEGPSRNPDNTFNQGMYGAVWIFTSGLTAGQFMSAWQTHGLFEPTVLDWWCASVGVGLFVTDDKDRGIPLIRRAADSVAAVLRGLTPSPAKVGT